MVVSSLPNEQDARHFSDDERNAAILSMLDKLRPIVIRLARAKGLPPHVLEDLYEDSVVEVVKASYRYNKNCGASFETFVSRRLQGAVIDGGRRADALGRTNRTRAKEIIAEYETAKSGEPDKAPSLQELVANRKLPPKDAAILLAVLENYAGTGRASLLTDSLDYSNDMGETGGSKTLNEKLAAKPASSDSGILLEQIYARANGSLNTRDKQLLEMIYVNDLTEKEAGEQLGIKLGSVGGMRASALAKLKKAAGVPSAAEGAYQKRTMSAAAGSGNDTIER
jgi:RNA polymerase sigma factor (sigma-70 family)